MRPTLSIRLHSQESPAVQLELLAVPADRPDAPQCDHSGCGRDEQPTLFGSIDLLCGRCGSRVETSRQ
jgi:hypothetical protein